MLGTGGKPMFISFPIGAQYRADCARFMDLNGE